MTFLCSPRDSPPCCVCKSDCWDGPATEECKACAYCTDGCVTDAPHATTDWCCINGQFPEEGDPVPLGILASPEADDLSEEAMPTGWPRPQLAGSLPTPYIADSASDLGHVNAARRRKVITEGRCQVCGEVAKGDVYVCARPGDALVIDGAAVCVRCWPAALQACPHLARLAAQGELLVWCVDLATLNVRSAPLTAQVSGMAVGYGVPEVEPSN